MKEASLIKFYFVRFFFLVLAFLQALVAIILLAQYEDTPKNRFAVFVFFSLTMILIAIHTVVFTTVKRVAIGKKIIVNDGKKSKTYTWDEVKELKHLAFLNMYSLHLKGKKKKIYFLTSHHSEAVFGLFSSELELLRKK